MPILGNWTRLGIDPAYLQERFPKLAGQFSGLLYIVGSGRCVWDDLERAGMAKNHDAHNHVMALNDMISYYPGELNHAYSNDRESLPEWLANRRRRNAVWGPPKHVHCFHHGPYNAWPWPGHGTSGLNAVYTGLALGYEEIRLCGVPLDNSGHFFDPPWLESNFGNSVRDDGTIPFWSNAAASVFEGRVKSYSGRTKALLGEPE